MPDYQFFKVDQYDKVFVLTWTELAATRILQDNEVQVELQAFVLTAKPGCVVVSFTQLAQCPSSLIASLIVLKRRLEEHANGLQLCGMSTQLREQFQRLHLGRVFEIHDSVSDAIEACELAVTN